MESHVTRYGITGSKAMSVDYVAKMSAVRSSDTIPIHAYAFHTFLYSRAR